MQYQLHGSVLWEFSLLGSCLSHLTFIFVYKNIHVPKTTKLTKPFPHAEKKQFLIFICRTHDIERLAREAFVDIGSNLQERRKKDLACTSAGHLKITEK